MLFTYLYYCGLDNADCLNFYIFIIHLIIILWGEFEGHESHLKWKHITITKKTTSFPKHATRWQCFLYIEHKEADKPVIQLWSSGIKTKYVQCPIIQMWDNTDQFWSTLLELQQLWFKVM